MATTATTKQVWISYAQFEAKTELETARSVFRRGYDHLRRQGLKEERCACWVSCAGLIFAVVLSSALAVSGRDVKAGERVFDRRWTSLTSIKGDVHRRARYIRKQQCRT